MAWGHSGWPRAVALGTSLRQAAQVGAAGSVSARAALTAAPCGPCPLTSKIFSCLLADINPDQRPQHRQFLQSTVGWTWLVRVCPACRARRQPVQLALRLERRGGVAMRTPLARFAGRPGGVRELPALSACPPPTPPSTPPPLANHPCPAAGCVQRGGAHLGCSCEEQDSPDVSVRAPGSGGVGGLGKGRCREGQQHATVLAAAGKGLAAPSRAARAGL